MATFSIIADVMVRGLDSLKELTGQVDKLGTASDKTSKKLDAVGDKSTKTATKVAPLRDRLQDLGTMFRDSGDAGGRFGDVLDAASVATTPLGAGILALVAGVGAAKLAFDALSASVSMYIETNEEAARASDRLDVAISSLNESVVDLALGEGGLTLITTNLSIATEEASENLNVFRESADGSKSASETLTERITMARVTMRNLGVATGGTGLALDALAEIARGLAADNGTLADSNRTLIRSFGDVVGAARRAGDAISSTVEQALVMLGLAESTTSKGMKIIGGKLAASPVGKAAAGYYQSLTKRLTPRRRGGGGRTKPAPVDPNVGIIDPAQEQRQAALMAGGFAGFAGFAALTGTAAVLKRRQDLARVRAQEDAEQQRRLDKAIADATALEEQANSLGGSFFKVVNTFQNLMLELKDATVQGFSAMTGEIANFLGAFAVGESTLSEFKDAMLDMAGDIANTFGDLFIKQGAGLVLFNPGLGAALIAAGLALKFVGGMATAKGSANRGGGGGRSAADNTRRDIAREISRSLRPSGDDGPAVTNIEVVIGGRSIQPEMVAIVDDIARQRRSRYLGRRMGV